MKTTKLILGVPIYYPLPKAIFQGIVHSTHNEFTVREINAAEFCQYESDRDDGKFGSSGK